MAENDGFYIMLISVHGLVRGFDMELGRDADTGGQITYVVELARALGEHPDVEKVDVVTRLIKDPKVDESYSRETEPLGPGVNIVRIPCGPNRYLAKESLWPHLHSFIDNILLYLRSIGRAPDLVHGHYADAGHVASRVSGLLDIPMAFTGHSLGRVKRQRLLDGGTKAESIERRYKITRRIEAEETALDNANFVVASTHQEVGQQYAVYDNHDQKRMLVIPPGVDLSRFTPPKRGSSPRPKIYRAVTPFLADWGKPMVLALSRPDPRKNIVTLVKAFGEHEELRELANLVVVAGNRDDIQDLDKGAKQVLTELLFMVDYYDLYGSVAYPKHHTADDVPDLYRIAAKTRGVFVNPALTEPFGLTLLEAAASGLPMVATEDGGPRDIVANCKNGLLVDPLDSKAMGKALYEVVSDTQQWRKWSRNGLRGVHRHFSWSAHVNKYMKAAKTAINRYEKRRVTFAVKKRLIPADRVLISDIDNTLIGDMEGLQMLLQMLKDAGDKVAFGIATGRSIDLTLKALKKWKIPTPTVLITSVGSAIRYGPQLVRDQGWEQHINYRWRPEALRTAMEELPGIELQPEEGQRSHKISYFVEPEKAPTVREIRRHLRRSNLHANVIYSHQAYLDLLPIRASKGMALRYFAWRWDIPLERCMVAGDSGNDEEMLTGNTLSVVVGNHDQDLAKLRGEPGIFFADGHYAWGIVEGIEHFNFLGDIRNPELDAVDHE